MNLSSKKALARKEVEGSPSGPEKRQLDDKKKQIRTVLVAGVSKYRWRKSTERIHASTIYSFLKKKCLR